MVNWGLDPFRTQRHGDTEFSLPLLCQLELPLFVIQSEAKNLNTPTNKAALCTQILPPFGRLNDKTLTSALQIFRFAQQLVFVATRL